MKPGWKGVSLGATVTATVDVALSDPDGSPTETTTVSWWSPRVDAYIYAFREHLHHAYVLERQRDIATLRALGQTMRSAWSGSVRATAVAAQVAGPEVLVPALELRADLRNDRRNTEPGLVCADRSATLENRLKI